MTVIQPPMSNQFVANADWDGHCKAIYAAFQVEELWRYEQDDVLRCYQLRRGEYQAVERSQFLPSFPISELQELVEEGRSLITAPRSVSTLKREHPPRET